MMISYSTANDPIRHVLQFAKSIILESVFLLLYVLFLPIKAINGAVLSSYLCGVPWVSKMQDLKLLMLRWWSFSSWGNPYVMHCFSWKGRHYFIYESLPHSAPTLRSANMQDEESSTLGWRSFSESGSNRVAFSFANQGCQYIGYA